MVPGNGRTIALLMVSEINDIKRFRSDRKLYALNIVNFGTLKKVDSSFKKGLNSYLELNAGSVNRSNITKISCVLVKWLKSSQLPILSLSKKCETYPYSDLEHLS